MAQGTVKLGLLGTMFAIGVALLLVGLLPGLAGPIPFFWLGALFIALPIGLWILLGDG